MQLDLSRAAEADLRGIFDWTERTFGLAQAIRYQQAMNLAIGTLTDAPESGRPYPGARPGTRRIGCGRHYIYFRLDGDMLRIVRILHHRMAQDHHLS